MIHLAVTAIVTVCAALFKGALSIIGFLLRTIGRIFRLFLSVLPLTGAALSLVGVFLIWFSFTGKDPLPASLPYHPDGLPFLTSFGALIFMLRDLRSAYPGLLSLIILIAAVILCVPVLLVLLLAHASIALMPVLPFLLVAEMAVYVIYGLLSRRTPFTQIRERWFFLFPKSANRHYERNYHAWLKRHAGEFADDTFGTPRRDGRRMERAARRRRRIEDYYDEYDEEYGEEHEEETETDGDDRRARFFDFDEEEKDRDGRAEAPRSAFDFFAGCRDLAGVERKYRSLVKIYHPDNQDGDTSAIQEINAQYAEAKRRFR